MAKTTDNPAYWLKRANDVRDIAKHISDQEMKDILEEIARGYERIADHVGQALNSPDDNSE
ncbi:MAG: hypothetical protein WBX25_26245 [Rhodomicrobium sp.]